MYFQGVLSIDPTEATEINRVRPTKGFARLAHILSAGLSSPREEAETFGAISILQQINRVMRSLDVDNLVSLEKDGQSIYEDTEGREGDLAPALDDFAAHIESSGNATLFETLNMVLEHKYQDLNILIDIQINRVHRVGENPIRVVINGAIDSLNASGGEDEVRTKMEELFASQEQYDAFVEKHRKQFSEFLDQIESAFHERMNLDGLIKSNRVSIIRTEKPVTTRDDIYCHDDYHYRDPYYRDYYGNNDAFFYAWMWSDHCMMHNIHCHDCNVVDPHGDHLFTVDEGGMDAQAVLDPEQPLPAAEVADEAVDIAEPAAEASGISADVDAATSDGGGWLGSFGDWGGGGDSGGDGGGASCGGSSCGGGGCGGGCSGGCGS